MRDHLAVFKAAPDDIRVSGRKVDSRNLQPVFKLNNMFKKQTNKNKAKRKHYGSKGEHQMQSEEWFKSVHFLWLALSQKQVTEAFLARLTIPPLGVVGRRH